MVSRGTDPIGTDPIGTDKDDDGDITTFCQCYLYECHIDVDFVQFATKMLSMEYAVERLQEFKEKVKSAQDRLLGVTLPVEKSTPRQLVATWDAGCAVKPICKDVGISTMDDLAELTPTRSVGVMAQFEPEESQSTPISPSSSEIPFSRDLHLELLEESESEDNDEEVSQEPREKLVPTEEIQYALKVLNEALLRGRTTSVVASAIDIILHEWFKVAGTKTSNSLDVKDYLDCFGSYSSELLRYIVNMPDGNGNTALHYAVSHENFKVVSILLDSTVCDPNKPNKAGYTCVMLVALAKITNGRQRQVVRRLLKLGDVNIKAAQHSQTALILSSSHGRLDTVKLLIEAGADINVQDEDGSTALMCAAEHGHGDIVKFLLAQEDCDSKITDNDSCTALRVAMDAGHKDIGVMLYAHMHFYKQPTLGTPISKSVSTLSKRSRSMTPCSSYTNSSPVVVAKKQHSSSSANYRKMGDDNNVHPW